MRNALLTSILCALLVVPAFAEDRSSAEEPVSAAAGKALDFLAAELKADPTYEKSRPRAFYAPILYAPLGGLAFLAGGSTRVAGPHAAGLRTGSTSRAARLL